jgi:hypothetical protein
MTSLVSKKNYIKRLECEVCQRPRLKLYHTGVLTSNSNPFHLALCSGSRCFVLLCAIALGCPRTWAPFSSRSNRPMFGRRMRGRHPQDSDTSSNVNTEFNFKMEIQKQLGRSGEERISMNSSRKFLRATIPGRKHYSGITSAT